MLPSNLEQGISLLKLIMTSLTPSEVEAVLYFYKWNRKHSCSFWIYIPIRKKSLLVSENRNVDTNLQTLQNLQSHSTAQICTQIAI